MFNNKFYRESNAFERALLLCCLKSKTHKSIAKNEYIFLIFVYLRNSRLCQRLRCAVKILRKAECVCIKKKKVINYYWNMGTTINQGPGTARLHVSVIIDKILWRPWSVAYNISLQLRVYTRKDFSTDLVWRIKGPRIMMNSVHQSRFLFMPTNVKIKVLELSRSFLSNDNFPPVSGRKSVGFRVPYRILWSFYNILRIS